MEIKRILERYEKTPENLLLMLHDIQNEMGANHIADETLVAISEYLNIPINKLEGTISFYTMLKRKKRGKYVIRLCKSPACFMANSLNLLEYLKEKLGVDVNETTSDNLFTLELTSCLGMCTNAPAMMINNIIYGDLTVEKINEILDNLRREK